MEIDKLPEGWTETTLPNLVGEDGIFNDGDWVESKDQDPNGGVRLIQLADIGDGEYLDKSSRYLTKEKSIELNCTFLKPGDVLISRMADPLARACIFPGDSKEAVTVVDVCILRPGSSSVEPRWIMHTVNAPQFRTVAKQKASGSTRLRISRSNLGELSVPLPPAAEQRRIADRIDAIQSHTRKARETLEQLPALVEEYRQSVLHAAFTGRLTADWRAAHPDVEPAEALLERILEERRRQWEKDYRAKYEAKGKKPPSGWKKRYKEPLAFSSSEDIWPLPEKWMWTNLDHLTISGPQNGLYLPKSKYGSGTPILRIDDYQVGWSRSADELQRVNADQSDVAKYSLQVGDLVINRVNSVSHLGKCLLVSERNIPSLFESNMMRLRPTSLGDRKYIEYYLQSAVGRGRLIRNAKHAVNQASINQTDVVSTPVPLPPEQEQQEIVRRVRQRLERIDQLAEHVEKARKRLEGLDRSVLAKAFRGELVETEAARARREGRDYEPADKLLARIRGRSNGRAASGEQMEMNLETGSVGT